MTTKKIKKAKRRQAYRNAASSRSVPRAIAVRPRGPIASDVAAVEAEAEAAAEAAEAKAAARKRDTPSMGALKAFGGALATTVAGAYLARQDFLPPKVMTGILSGLGAVLALEGPQKWKSLGLGAMSAAGGQLGFMLIDDQLIKSADEKDKKESAPSKPAASTSAPAKRQAGDIPADALARAYERARLRMALTSDAPN